MEVHWCCLPLLHCSPSVSSMLRLPSSLVWVTPGTRVASPLCCIVYLAEHTPTLFASLLPWCIIFGCLLQILHHLVHNAPPAHHIWPYPNHVFTSIHMGLGILNYMGFIPSSNFKWPILFSVSYPYPLLQYTKILFPNPENCGPMVSLLVMDLSSCIFFWPIVKHRHRWFSIPLKPYQLGISTLVLNPTSLCSFEHDL